MKLSAEDIRRTCGDLPDWKLNEIQASGADLDDLKQALAWCAGDDETTPMRHIPPGSAAARVYDVLMAGEEDDDRDGGRM